MKRNLTFLVILASETAIAEPTLYAGVEVAGGRQTAEHFVDDESAVLPSRIGGHIGLWIPFRSFPRITLGPELRFRTWELIANERSYESQLIDIGVTPRAVLVRMKSFDFYGSIPMGLSISRLGGEASSQLYVPKVGFGMNLGIMLGLAWHVRRLTLALDGGYRLTRVDHNNENPFVEAARYEAWLHQAVGRVSIGVRL